MYLTAAFFAGLSILATREIVRRIFGLKRLSSPDDYQSRKLDAYKGELERRNEVMPHRSQATGGHHRGRPVSE